MAIITERPYQPDIWDYLAPSLETIGSALIKRQRQKAIIEALKKLDPSLYSLTTKYSPEGEVSYEINPRKMLTPYEEWSLAIKESQQRQAEKEAKRKSKIELQKLQLQRKKAIPSTPKQRALAQQEAKAESTYLTKPSIKKTGFFSPLRVLPGYAYFNEATQKVISNIKTIADLNELLKNRAGYEKAGVNVQAIIDYYKKKK